MYIYYKDNGVRKLFRKVDNQSSCYDPTETHVREDGDYIYEEFFEPASRADVKVYAVGGDYFHAEARKAPHVDGIVDRDGYGREIRDQVELTSAEHAICRRVVNAFGQLIIGFDLLRGAHGQRFIIDVNGWSLVKHSITYSQHCARILTQYVRMRLHERTSLHIRALHLARAHSLKFDTDQSIDSFDNRQSVVPVAITPCAV